MEAQTRIRELYDKCVKRDKEYAELYFEDKVKSKLEKRKPVFRSKKDQMMEELQAFIKQYNKIHLNMVQKEEENEKLQLEVKLRQKDLAVTKPQENNKANLELEIKEMKNTTDMEGLYSNQLHHMADRFKEDLLSMQRPI